MSSPRSSVARGGLCTTGRCPDRDRRIAIATIGSRSVFTFYSDGDSVARVRSLLMPAESSFGTYPGSRTNGAIVLIATDQEAWLRSLESVLTPMGYAVLAASTGEKVIEALQNSAPDLVIIQTDLDDIGGYELCRILRAEPFFDPCVPILLTSSQPFTREQMDEMLLLADIGVRRLA